MKNHSQLRLVGSLVLAALVGIMLYIISLYSYLLFHVIVECSAILVAFGVFAVAWNTERFTEYSFFLVLGVAYLFVAMLDLTHTFAYSGMGIFPGYDSNLPTQLWIAARYLESVSILVAIGFVQRKTNKQTVFICYAVITVVLHVLIFAGFFPDCYIEGVGLTLFKIVSEYVVVGILCIAVLAYGQKREMFEPTLWRLLILSIILTQGSELAFTLYIDVYGVMNWVGHYLKLLSFSLLYVGMVRNSLQKPYDSLFRNLEVSVQREQARVKQLEQVNRDLEAFAASLSHDIKSPLQVIRSYAELIGTTCVKADSEVCEEYIEEMVERVDQVDQLVEALLRLASLSVRTATLQEVDVSQMAHEVIQDLTVQSPDREVSVDIEEGMHAAADPDLIHILLSNLIGNAWKYTQKSESALIEFGVIRQNGSEVFFIRDNGIGFDTEDADGLFEPFQRLHNAADFEGAGIGLVTAKKVIEAHGGEIWFESEEGIGTTVFFTLQSH